jgi:alpha-1,6-mannosyltransferase
VRVVDLTQWYGPRSGGIRTYLHAKARWAREAGLPHAAIVSGRTAGEDTVAASPFVHVRGLSPARRWGYRLVPRPGAVLQALDALEPSVVVLHDAFAHPSAVATWARPRGVAVCMVCHSDLSLAAQGLPRPLRAPAGAVLARVQRRGLAQPDVVLTTSRALGARLGPVTSAAIVRSPLGIDLADFAAARPDPALRAMLAPPGAPLLLYAGRLSSEKRIDLLPAALAALGGPAVLVVAGAGAAERVLRRRAARLGVADRMRLLGHVADRGQLARLMATADVFLHPNPTEPYGLAPLEALAAGCRVVAPDAHGSRETLGGRGAVLVAPGDPAAMAAGVREALARPRPRPELDDLDWGRTFAREWVCYRALVGGGAAMLGAAA